MEWKHYKMDELIEEISMGPFGSDVKKEFYVDNGVPILNGSNLQGFKLQEDSFGYLTKEKADSLKKCNAHRGDIIVTHRGTLGQIVYVPVNSKYDRYVISQSQFRFRCKADLVDVQYLVYYFHTREGQYKILANASQVGVPALARATSTFRLIDIKLPSLKDQRRIASILSSLDRKIELNNKMNADLEEMAQAIFKNWFVDFEPFKDGKFVDSELGMIPEGWKVSQIADIPHILETGKRPKGGAVEKGIPSVGAEHVKGMCAYDYSKTKYINCEFAAKLKTGKINGYELMIYKDGGKPGYFIPNFSIFGEGYPFENCYLNEHVFKLDFDGNKEFNIFCYFFFKTEQIMSYFNAQGAKAAIPGINKKDVENIYIFSPDNESVIKFGEFAYPLFKQMLKNAIENRTLSLLRDTLLPRLMSGEIEVPE